MGIWSCGWPARLVEAESDVFRATLAPLGALPARFLAIAFETPSQVEAIMSKRIESQGPIVNSVRYLLL